MQGLAWAMVFVVLDAAQAVYFGGVLQRHDAFLLGGTVFGLSAAGCLAWTAIRAPKDLRQALGQGRALAGLNISVAGAFVAYFHALQMIEPAVAFALFAGVIPIVTIIAGRVGIGEAERSRNRIEAVGNATIVAGLSLLAIATVLGLSGFVRGGAVVAAAGVALAVVAGAFITFMLLCSARLDAAGVGPVAQYGLRFPLYLVVAACGVALGLDAKGPVTATDFAVAVAIGMVLLAFPIYAVQKAVSLVTPLTIGSIAATSPLIVFVMQIVEGRVAVSGATAAGLTVYFAGALVAAWGGFLATGGRDRTRT